MEPPPKFSQENLGGWDKKGKTFKGRKSKDLLTLKVNRSKGSKYIKQLLFKHSMSKLKQTFASATILSVLIGGALPGGVSALTSAELQAQIDALMAQLSALQGQLPASTASAGGPAACSGVSLSRNLTVGSSEQM